MGWNEQVREIIRGRARERNKDGMNYSCRLQLLRNPCPALCLLQGAGVGLDPGERGEGGETAQRGEEKRSRPTVP